MSRLRSLRGLLAVALAAVPLAGAPPALAGASSAPTAVTTATPSTSPGAAFGLAGFSAQFGDQGAVVNDGGYVAMARTPTGLGLWLLTAGGTVLPRGDALWYGDASTAGTRGAAVDIAPTPSGNGYWIVYSDDSVVAYGGAPNLGGVPDCCDRSNPAVSITPTATGLGYWVALERGGYLGVGDAGTFPFPPTGPICCRVAAIERSATGNGVFVAWDGGTVQTFGDATFLGDLAGQSASPVADLQVVPGQGYLLLTADGVVHPFGVSSAGNAPGAGPFVAVELDGAGGYWALEQSGQVHAVGTATAVPGAPGLDEEWTAILPSNASSTVASYTAAISYGDGTSGPATIDGAGGGPGFPVHSAHAYARAGHYTATVTVSGPGGSVAVTIPTTIDTPPGYWIVAADGGVFPFGGAVGWGSTGGIRLNEPVVGMAAHGSLGYWLVARDGGVFPFGDAAGFGSTGGIHLNAPIVGMAATASGNGYWLVASDGGIFPFGDAVQHSYGSLGATRLPSPVVGMARTPTGNGYWLAAASGAVYAFGDAGGDPFGNSVGCPSAGPCVPAIPADLGLNRPIVGIDTSADGHGYWLVAGDGGIFPMGEGRAHSYGSTGGIRLNRPMVGMARTPDGNGYWFVAADGGIFPFGDAVDQSYGSLGNVRLNQPVVGMART